MDKIEVDLGVMQDEIIKLENTMNDYEECVELIGHLTRVFNREGYWDFKETLNGIYKSACKHENDLKQIIESMQSIHDLYTKAESTLVDNGVSKQKQLYTSNNTLNVEFILGGMRSLTREESYKLIKSLSIRGDINLGINTGLLLATTTLHTYTNSLGKVRFKLKESTNSTYTERFKLFEEQTQKEWSKYGEKLVVKNETSVYKTINSKVPAVIRVVNKKDDKELVKQDVTSIMIETINSAGIKETAEPVKYKSKEITNSVEYETEIGSKIISKLFDYWD